MNIENINEQIKDHEVYKYFRNELEFSEEVAVELAIDIVVCQ